jgi:hypothetical protein
MIRLIEFGILVVLIVVVLRLIRGGPKPPRSPEILPPESPNKRSRKKQDKPR